MNKEKEYKTNFLFSTPNYWVGAGSIFNLAGNYFEFDHSESAAEADSRALDSDWGITGKDIESAFKQLQEEGL